MPVSPNKTNYLLTGSNADPVLVLIHGIGLNLHIWDDYVPVLSESCRVLRYDLFGHGGSGRCDEPLSLTTLSRQLAELMDELDIERGAIVGFSLGGMINRRFAMDYPHRVSSLVIMNSPHERGPAEQAKIERRATQSTDGPEKTLDEALQRWFTPEFLQERPDKIAQVRSWVLAGDPQSFLEVRRVLAAGVTELVRPEPPISHPALVLTSEHDSGSTPDMGRAITGEIPGAQAIIVPGLKHLGMLENPSLFLDPMVKFLDSIFKP